jgi:hypothetical protein
LRKLLAVVCFAFLFATPFASAQKAAGNLDPLKFLVGDWIGEGGGEPGQGTGGFSFREDLQGKILVRKNYSEYPATKDKPAYRHDDFMVVYYDDTSSSFRAVYFDNEGHHIEYRVQVAEDGKSCTMESAPSAGAPSYRLTYNAAEAGRLKIKFEIAPPGIPAQFKPYIDATARRSSPK